MARFCIAICFSVFLLADCSQCMAQTTALPRPGERIFTPLQAFRDRANQGLIPDALNGRISPRFAELRRKNADERIKNLEDKKKLKEAELKKVEAEAKKAELEAKLLEEQDAEKNKPWDVADPENEDEDSPLLEMAANSKQQQDLAPKKIEALRYIASLGCNKDPKVQEAILAGLKDYNPEVRQAAIYAIIASVRGPIVFPPASPEAIEAVNRNPWDPPKAEGDEKKPAEGEQFVNAEAGQPGACVECQGKKKRKRLIKGLCSRCRGNGCTACNYCGEAMEVYAEPCPVCVPCQACNTHDGCKSCCPSEDLLKELKKIAYAPDPLRDSCYYEPVLDIRNLALEALNLCPPLKEEKPDVEKPNFGETEGNEKKKSGSLGETNNDDALLDDATSPQTPQPEEDPSDGQIEGIEDDSAFAYGSPFQPANFRRSTESENMLSAKIAKFYNDGYLLKFDGEYLIPEGFQLFVMAPSGDTQTVQVVVGEAGFARVKPLDGRPTDLSGRIKFGIIENGAN